jgi:hypothetical protein
LKPAANFEEPIPGFSDKPQSHETSPGKTPFPVVRIVKDLVAEEPNLPGSIQRLCRLGYMVCMIHDISFLENSLLNLEPLTGIASRHCFLLATGRLKIHFIMRPSPVFF